MRTILNILLLWVMLVVSGCNEKLEAYSTKNGRNYTVDEICYKGIIYVNFRPRHNDAWGSVKIGSDGKPMTCVE